MSNKHANLSELFTAMANAIRSRAGSTDVIIADDFPEVIDGLRVADVNYVTFMSDDGATKLYRRAVADGDDCADPVVRELIPAPTKKPTADYEYSYLGWAISAGGDVDDDALKAVVEDKTLYAAYVSAVRTQYTRTLINRTITEYSSDAIETVGNDAFRKCIELASVDFPNAISIGVSAFSGCEKLISVDFPNAISIGDSAFSGCKKLETANIPKTKSIERHAFYTCRELSTAEFLEVITIGDFAFQHCDKLMSVAFPLVTSVGQYALAQCPVLTLVNLPLINQISYGMLNGCTSLTTADFAAIISIREYALGICKSLTRLIIRNTETICSLSSTNSLNTTPIADGTGYVYVPRKFMSDDDATMDYRRATNWSTYANQLRILEDYTIDGTVTGELDPAKI